MKVQFQDHVIGAEFTYRKGAITDTENLPKNQVETWLNHGVVKPVNVPNPRRKATKKAPRKAVETE